MQVIHNLGILTLKRDVSENVGFLLANKKGSYCSFFNYPSSTYHGLFYFDESAMKMYKFIDNIEIINSAGTTSLKNGFYFAERVKSDVSETFFMPQSFNSLIYELDSKREIDVVLDCKNAYDNSEWGRYYEIFDEQNCLVVKFSKKIDEREEKNLNSEEFTLYLAIKFNGDAISRNNLWIERHYSSDEERNSIPFKRHVYNALRLKGNGFVFSVAKNKNEAIKECIYVFGNLEALKRKEKENFLEILRDYSVKKILSNQDIGNNIKVAYINALNSLNNLRVTSRNHKNLFAGLPWFFQFWSRDSLVSLRALYKIDKRLADEMLLEYLKKINGDGRLDNLIGHHKSLKLGCADAHGWLFLRCNEIINRVNASRETIKSIKAYIKSIKESQSSNSAKIKDYIRKCNLVLKKKEENYHKILDGIETSLEKSIHRLMKSHTSDNLEISDELETWMDTQFGNDNRKGALIEIQAFRLQMYKVMHEITLNHKYKALENLLKIKIREKFWNGKLLADGLGDFTIRPNIFIAAYAYPELLKKDEWEACFENALKNLWLEWGGLSTIDKSSSLFTGESTGENIKSYHRGDSWFWINNLAAITLNRINKNKFKKNIQKILESSAEEILWKGCIGCHSELSSAKELSSKGCFNQAWSNAMFVELIDEVFS